MAVLDTSAFGFLNVDAIERDPTGAPIEDIEPIAGTTVAVSPSVETESPAQFSAALPIAGNLWNLAAAGQVWAPGIASPVVARTSPATLLPQFDDMRRLPELMNPARDIHGDGLGMGRTELIAQTFNSTTGRYEFTGDRDVDAVLIGSRWTITEFTFSFPTSGAFYTGYGPDDNEPDSFQAFNAAQQQAARYALGLISSYANITFTEITETATNHGTIRFGQTGDAGVPSAEANFPSSSVKAGDVWFGTTGQPFYATPAVGNWGQATIMHELGHAMGLKHGHSDYTNENLVGYLDQPPGGGARRGSVQLSGENDGQAWSLMTYRSDPSAVGADPNDSGAFQGEGFNQPQTYMQQDIAALQHLYGANFSTNAGNTVYSWSPTTGQQFINGVGQAIPTSNKVFMTVWDGNGTDTYDLSNYATSLTIDLNPGEFSTFSATQLVNHQAHSGGSAVAVGNVANALLYQGDLRSLIENANGGSAADRIVGNQIGNALAGNGGADELVGGAGNDSLSGGEGGDTLYGDTKPGSSPGVGSSGDGVVVKNPFAGNSTLNNAMPLDGQFSLADDDWILDSTSAPHVTIVGYGDGNYDFYRVTVAAGTTLKFDVDSTTNFLDSYIELYNSSGTRLAYNDDSLISAGAGGSTVVQDSLLTYTVATSGTYYIAIGNFGGLDLSGQPTAFPVFQDQNYILHVSAYGTPELGAGTAGNDTLDGGDGADTMIGGSGDDTYVFTAGDTIVESANGGTDTVESASTFSLASVGNIENLRLTGNSAVDGTGNSGHNAIAGNSRANMLSGGGGNDTLSGGGGNDTLDGGAGVRDIADYGDKAAAVVATLNGASDAIVRVGGAVEDRLRNIEGLSGGSGNDALTGDTLANILSGAGGNDTLTGGSGRDTLDGGAGRDTASYAGSTLAVVVTLNSDTPVDVSVGGTADDSIVNVEDVVGGRAGDSLTGDGLANLLSGEVGNDTLRGQGGHDELRGGAGQDTLRGDSGNDTMDGGTGPDTMYGGGGNDVYIVDNRSDRTIEVAGEGTDTVYSALSRTLSINLEVLYLQGSANLTGNGNELANRLFGNDGGNLLQGFDGADTIEGGAGADTIKGGEGADSMTGGAGNDIFYVDAAGDSVNEGANGGIDTVYSSIRLTLAANVEHLRLQGTGNLTGTGNALNNKLFGNAGNNTLSGLDGNDILDGKDGTDTLSGGRGDDTLTGGAHADVFRFAAANAGADRITDFQRSVDRFDLSGGSFTSLRIAGNDTILTHDGGTIRIVGISTLSLGQWNALLVPSGSASELMLAHDGLDLGWHGGDGLHVYSADWAYP